jgi:hypothetical protein
VTANGNRFFGIQPGSISSYKNTTKANKTIELSDDYYGYIFNGFYFTKAFSYWTLGSYFFRDLAVPITLLILNALILAQMRKITKRRIKLAGGGANNASRSAANVSSNHASVILAMRAERRRSIMILLTGVNYLLGHTLNVIKMIESYFNLSSDYLLWNCVSLASYGLLFISYQTSFFFYYFLNTQFNHCAKQTFKFLFFPVWWAVQQLRSIKK